MGWVSGTAPSLKMSGPLGLRIFLMADVFMRFSRRIRLKPLGTPEEMQVRGSAGYSRKQVGSNEAALTSHIG